MVLGHYRIVSALGAGGMGEVFLATDTRLNRQVAIKLLPQSQAGEEAQKRMLREARMVATIEHPNVCTIFEIGDDAGRPFIAMQYVQGETLSERSARGPMTPAEVAEIGAQVTAALAEAHSRGIVHRDIKPGNIMITPAGLVKVLDFGLAKSFDTNMDSATELIISTPGMVAGTVPYMSPEQLRAEPVDGRSDLFSLGIVLYELLTGRRPFDRPTAIAVITAIQHEDPLPPQSESPSLDRLILRALAKPLARRFASASEMHEALAKIARRKTRATPARAKSRTTAAGPQRIASLALLPLSADIDDENFVYLEDGVLDRVTARLSQIPKLRVIAHSTAMRYRGQNVDRAAVAAQLKVDALITGHLSVASQILKLSLELAGAKDGTVLWRGDFERTGREIEALAVEVAAQIAGKIREHSSAAPSRPRTRVQNAVDPAAEKLYLRGRLQWNKRHPEAVRQAIASFQEAVETDPTYANAHAGLADAYLMLAFLQALPPSAAVPKAKAAAMRAIELDESMAEPHASLGYSAGFLEWDWAVAEREFNEAMRLNPNYSWAPHWYGLLLAPRSSFEKALHYLTLARDLDPLSPIITAAIGSPYHLHRRFEEAARIYATVLESEPTFAPAHFYLGQAYEQLGRFEDAIRHIERASEIAGDTSTFIGTFGHCLARSGRRGDAEAVLKQMTETGRIRYTSPYHFMLVHLGLGNYDEAVTQLGAALEEHTSWLYLIPRDPRFDPLRDRRDFRDMVSSHGLEGGHS